jgi:outer membrane lipopolysaccharide assembly protein LptE/RlpB
MSKGQDTQPVNSDKNWVFRLFKVLLPLIYYAPAYLLVWFSFNQFGSFNERKEQQNTDRLTLEQKVLKLEKEVGIKENPIKNSLEDRLESLERQIIIKDKANKEYVVGIIEKEARAQADKASADAVDKAKSELFSQISFPVLFAIASIFAAFAVKDILTEILKEQEREKLRKELYNDLSQDLINEIPKVIRNQDISKRLRSVELYSSWLEHESLLETVNKLTHAITSSTDSDTEDTNLKFALRLLDRSSELFDLAFTDFQRERVSLLKDMRYRFLHLEVKNNSSLSSHFEQHISERIEEIKQISPLSSSPELPYERGKELYEIQKELFFQKLDAMKEDRNSTITEDDINELRLAFLNREKDILAEERERRKDGERYLDERKDEQVELAD